MRWLVAYYDCSHGWMFLHSDHNADFIFPWYRTYEDAEKAIDDFMRKNPQTPDWEDDYWHNFFIFSTTEAHEIDSINYDGDIHYTFRKAI